jgi:hypothetical protein
MAGLVGAAISLIPTVVETAIKGMGALDRAMSRSEATARQRDKDEWEKNVKPGFERDSAIAQQKKLDADMKAHLEYSSNPEVQAWSAKESERQKEVQRQLDIEQPDRERTRPDPYGNQGEKSVFFSAWSNIQEQWLGLLLLDFSRLYPMWSGLRQEDGMHWNIMSWSIHFRRGRNSGSRMRKV